MHFALIPLGKMSLGEIEIKIVQLPMEKRFVDAGFKPVDASIEARTVCGSFKFRIDRK